MGRGISRRRLLAAAAAVGAAAARGRPRAAGAQAGLCFWRREQGPLCSWGTAKEYWCEYCNEEGARPEVTRCGWRVVGRC